MTALPILAGTFQAEAIDINDAGGVVGYATAAAGVYPDGTAAYRQDALVWQGGSVHAITPPNPNEHMFAQAIDASGRVAVSVYSESSGLQLPGRWTPDVPNGSTGTVEILDWLSGYPYDINDFGAVCGYDANVNAVVWDDLAPTVLGKLPGNHLAYAACINRAGTVAGTSVVYYDDGFNFDEVYTAFAWDAAHGMRDLNALLNSNSEATGRLSETFAINYAGQILA